MKSAVVLLVGILAFPDPLPAEDNEAKAQPGAYCPLPAKGEVPRCLAPAQAQYSEFFQALEGGALDEAQAQVVESDLQRGDAYLALSSLSYGYYRLAQQAAEAPDADPKLVARLQRWNELLSGVYEGSAADSPFRGAVREAAYDLAQQAPAVETRCEDGGSLVQCSTASELLGAFRTIDRRTGTRAGLGRLLERLFGDRE